ncbi:MAG: YicC family protein, partial [Rhodobacteraceae bacterium]|nr:YicC family protein [Paracoccaceae bacterium]
MTGFAAASGRHEDWSWTMEVRAVNGRGFDLKLRAPDW